MPAAIPTKPGSATLPFFGVLPKLVNIEGKTLEVFFKFSDNKDWFFLIIIPRLRGMGEVSLRKNFLWGSM